MDGLLTDLLDEARWQKFLKDLMSADEDTEMENPELDDVPSVPLGKRAGEPIPTDMQPDVKKPKLEEA